MLFRSLFESVEQAAVSCAKMLAELLLAGGQASASTFRHDEATGELTPMREKQDALYRFLPDGDLGMQALEPLDAHEALWDALPAPGAWRARSGALRGPLVDDPAAESLCWLAASLLGRSPQIEAMPEIQAETKADAGGEAKAEAKAGAVFKTRPRPEPIGASLWISQIEKAALSALSRLHSPTPREPRPRVALAQGLAWSVLAQGQGAPARVALDIALEALRLAPGGDSRAAFFDAGEAGRALAQALRSLAPDRSAELQALLEPWLAQEPAAASWREFSAGKQKALGSLVGLARRQWPQEDPQRMGEALRALAARSQGGQS